MDIISPINNSLTLITRLREISKSINEAEVKNVLADLSLELADAKLAAADLKMEILNLKEENSELKAQQIPREKPSIEKNCYYFDDDISRLYCTACFDSKGAMSLTSKAMQNHRVCGVCNSAVRER